MPFLSKFLFNSIQLITTESFYFDGAYSKEGPIPHISDTINHSDYYVPAVYRGAFKASRRSWNSSGHSSSLWYRSVDNVRL